MRGAQKSCLDRIVFLAGSVQTGLMQSLHYTKMLAAATLCIFGTACAKKQVAVAPPPPAPVAASTPAPRETAPPPAPGPTPPAQPVAQPNPSPYPNAATRARIDELIGRIQDAYFDYDRHSLRSDAITTLAADSKELATILAQYPGYKLKIEGYCDERGSAEYNIARGCFRAMSPEFYVVSAGVSGNQLDTVSYG